MNYGWTLDETAWQKLGLTVASLRWFCVPFDNAHIMSVPEQSGVYLICASPPVETGEVCERLFNVIYAGRSKTSIRNRFSKHCTAPDRDIAVALECYGYARNKFGFYYAVAPGDRVVEIECRLIECYGPPANRRGGDNVRIPVKICVDKSRPAG